MDSIIDVVRYYGRLVDDNRSLNDILSHLRSEVEELQFEVDSVDSANGTINLEEEAIDVIACAFDIILRFNPSISNDELEDLMIKKCRKWFRKSYQSQ